MIDLHYIINASARIKHGEVIAGVDLKGDKGRVITKVEGFRGERTKFRFGEIEGKIWRAEMSLNGVELGSLWFMLAAFSDVVNEEFSIIEFVIKEFVVNGGVSF